MQSLNDVRKGDTVLILTKVRANPYPLSPTLGSGYCRAVVTGATAKRFSIGNRTFLKITGEEYPRSDEFPVPVIPYDSDSDETDRVQSLREVTNLKNFVFKRMNALSVPSIPDTLAFQLDEVLNQYTIMKDGTCNKKTI